MAGPETQTRTPTQQQEEPKQHILPPYSVILHNDAVNDMAHVVRSLLRSVPSLNLAKATEIMFEAHNQGRARVVVCPLELAELYRDRLQSYKLTATIEKA
jgi:ATP-dependent Clp protease adaptor protein ClpS